MSLAAAMLGACCVAAGCGSSSSSEPTSRELALQRSQLVLVSEGLRAAQGAVKRELAASRSAWPSVAGGLPQAPAPSLRSAVSDAGRSASKLPEPGFLAKAGVLTGPAAGLAGLYETYMRLASHGWRLTGASLDATASEPSSATAFARANSSLYIDAIYDAHFDLSLLGKSLTDAYRKLGGAHAFGAALTPSEVSALAAAYSIPAVRLRPHPGHAVEAH